MTEPIDLARERRIRALDERMRAAVAGRPALAWRTAEYLATGTDDAPLSGAVEAKRMSPVETVSLMFRLPRDLTDRAQALVESVERDPKLSAVGRVTRAAVLRLAMAEGLTVLERRYSPPEKALASRTSMALMRALYAEAAASGDPEGSFTVNLQELATRAGLPSDPPSLARLLQDDDPEPTPPAPPEWVWMPTYQGGGGMKKSHRLHTDSARTLCGGFESPAGPSAWEPAPGLPRCRNCERAAAKRDGADK